MKYLALLVVGLFCGPSVRAQTVPVISNISPNGARQFQPSGLFSFNAASSAGINANGISIQLTGKSLSGQMTSATLNSANGLTVGGTSTSRAVSAVLGSNLVYTVIINVTNGSGQSASTSVSFDTINPAYVFEAEDYDYNSRQFIDNPQTNAYLNLSAVAEVDTHGSGGANAYRSNNPGLATESVGDLPRSPYIGTGKTDYDVGFNDGGKWGNYTRTFPAGTYNIFMRGANPNGSQSDSASMSLVTSGWGTASQTTSALGQFLVPGTGNWQVYTWVPLLDANGNLVNFTGGAVKTLRVTTDNGSYNANCYLLMPADLSLPIITNVYPDGANFFQFTNRLSFTAISVAGIKTSNIQVALDGVNVSSNLVFSGSLTNWTATCPLVLNTNHVAMITVLANNGQSTTNVIGFNSFSATNYQWEAEDYDYNAGQYFDNPQTNAYAGLASMIGVDNRQSDLGASPFLYRPNSPAPSTTMANDAQRLQFTVKTDYNIGFIGAGSWCNYTRHYPAGTYYVFGRFAEGQSATEAVLSQLISGYGTSLQTSNLLGTFNIPNTGGWAVWAWSQLKDAAGNPVKLRFEGSPVTLQLGGSPIGGHPEVNVNFLMLVSAEPDVFAVIQAINSGNTNVLIRFSKPIEAASVTNVANYVFTNGTIVSKAMLSPDNVTVALTTSPLIFGTNYTIVINGIRDRMNLPNTIATNTAASFQALPYTLSDLGNPTSISSAKLVGNGLDVTAVGSDTGGTNDQGNFSYQVCSGNFDVAVRIANLDVSDVFAKAGLMAREDLTSGARFAAALTTPAMNGSFLGWRNPAGSPAGSAGNFPANYPNTWLRLQRVGNVFAGYASYDGQVWTQLGSATITMPNQVYLGLSVSSHNANQATTAQFRDIVNVTNALLGVQNNPHEQLGPSSRKTPIVFSEIMYKPASRTDGNNLEFIEIYNSNPWFQDISGYKITCADMNYTFPANTIMPGGEFFVVVASPQGIKNVYGLTTNVFGPYSGSLKKSEELTLLNEQGAVLLTVPYTGTAPWPVAANATGHSIVLANPSYGEADPRAWSISDVAGGSPGQMEAFHPSPLCSVMINEFLAHTDPPDCDYVELYNHSTNSVDISGCILTDNPATNKFVIPNGTILPPRGFASFAETDMGFGLDAAGESIYFKNPDQSRILDAVQFDAQQNGVATGRWPDGANDFYRLSTKTPGSTNAPILASDVVVNELMYDPITENDDDQYIELFNRTTNSVNLSGWQLSGGVAYTIPTNTLLASGGYLVVARNKTNLFAKYPNLNAGNTVGNFSGKLSHNGEHLALTMPAEHRTTDALGNPVTNIINIAVNDLTYGSGGRWGRWSSGGGSSLELVNPDSNNRLAANWADSDETQKSAWTNIETTGVLDNGQNYESAIAHAQIGLLEAGECLVDNIEVNYNSVNYVSNSTFESGTNGWSFQGCMSRSSLENEGYGGSGHSLHIRASDTLWTGDNSCQVSLNNTSLQAGQTATLRFKARWLRGWPEALLRLNGNWLEAAGALSVPNNLGTPGLPNSRYVANPGPAIYQVKHTPALPAAYQPAVVTAQVHDLAGLQNLTLYFRLDPSMNNYSTVAMRDDGMDGDAIAGDGVFSATIPGQPANQIVAFYISAVDNLSATSRFPVSSNDKAPIREVLVMFGDSNPGGSFGVYHLWVSQTNANRWSMLGNLSNDGNDATFVSGSRIIYNMQARFSGSPWHQTFNTPSGNLCHYSWDFPDDDKFLGVKSFNKIHQPGNFAGDDASIQREQLAYTFLRQLGVPAFNRRYVAVYVNGNRRGSLMEDAQCPGGDVVSEYFPGDPGGWLYKMQPWFECAPDLNANGQTIDFTSISGTTLMPYTTTGGMKKTARYRYNYLMRRTPGSASDYTNIFALVDAAGTFNSQGYVTNMQNCADMENWMRVFAANHAAGNWDCFGGVSGQNVYGYVGTSGTKYSLLMFDFNLSIGNDISWQPGENLFTVNGADPNLGAIYNNPTFRRMYWRALGELINGPLAVSNSGPLIDAKYNIFTANGLLVENPNDRIKTWLTQARSSIAAQLAVENATGFTLNPVTVSNAVALLSGVAPVDAQTIWINGVAYPVTWLTVTNWTATVPLHNGTNQFNVTGVDSHGVMISGETNSTSVVYAGSGGTPALPVIFINEWMADNTKTLADPADGNFEDWFELYNPGTNAVDLGGYFLTDKLSNKFQCQVPTNGQYIVPSHGFLLVWADSETNQNFTNLPDLHVSFALSKSGEAIGLFAPDGTMMDAVNFGAQISDISQGRIPDGGTNIVFLTTATPRTSNIYGISPLQLAGQSHIGNQFKLSWQTTAGFNYQIEYKDNLNAPTWTSFGNIITGTGGIVTITNDAATSTLRFFRIRFQ